MRPLSSIPEQWCEIYPPAGKALLAPGGEIRADCTGFGCKFLIVCGNLLFPLSHSPSFVLPYTLQGHFITRLLYLHLSVCLILFLSASPLPLSLLTPYNKFIITHGFLIFYFLVLTWPSYHSYYINTDQFVSPFCF